MSRLDRKLFQKKFDRKPFQKRLERKRRTPVLRDTYNPQALSGVIKRRNANLFKKGLIENVKWRNGVINRRNANLFKKGLIENVKWRNGVINRRNGLQKRKLSEKRKLLAASLEIPERNFRLTAFSGSGSLTRMEKPEVWLLKGDRNISDLYRLPFRRLPLLSGVS